jgi:hypothetical protein
VTSNERRDLIKKVYGLPPPSFGSLVSLLSFKVTKWLNNFRTQLITRVDGTSRVPVDRDYCWDWQLEIGRTFKQTPKRWSDINKMDKYVLMSTRAPYSFAFTSISDMMTKALSISHLTPLDSLRESDERYTRAHIAIIIIIIITRHHSSSLVITHPHSSSLVITRHHSVVITRHHSSSPTITLSI